MLSINKTDKVAVASRSFSMDPFLKSELTKKYAHVRFNDTGETLKKENLVSFLKEASKAIVALETIDHDLLKQLPNLNLISKYGVGLDNIDFKALKNNNVQLAWKGGVNRRSVAELALHFILGCVRGSFASHHEVQLNKWVQFKGQNLTGKTVGILGLGHVGQELVPMLKPFQVKILAFDLFPKNEFCKLNDIEQVSLEETLIRSDVLSIHLPLTSKTKNILSSDNLNLIKKGSFLINTARGGLIDENHLAKMLISRHVQSAAFDVFENEPPFDSKLLSLENFYSTAHIGGSSIQSIHLMGLAAIEGLDNGKTAEPINFFDYPL